MKESEEPREWEERKQKLILLFETDGNLSNFLTIINGIKYKGGVIDVISFPA